MKKQPGKPTARNRRITYEIKTYQVDSVCGSCNRGRLRPSGPTEDNVTPHECTFCKVVHLVTGEVYPYTKTEQTQVGYDS